MKNKKILIICVIIGILVIIGIIIYTILSKEKPKTLQEQIDTSITDYLGYDVEIDKYEEYNDGYLVIVKDKVNNSSTNNNNVNQNTNTVVVEKTTTYYYNPTDESISEIDIFNKIGNVR